MLFCLQSNSTGQMRLYGNNLINDVLSAWKHLEPSTMDCSPQSNAPKQKAWNGPVVKSAFMSLLEGASLVFRAHLLAVEKKESGAWLNAPSISSIGMRMEDVLITTAIGICLGNFIPAKLSRYTVYTI
jgi:hypothetical protein